MESGAEREKLPIRGTAGVWSENRKTLWKIRSVGRCVYIQYVYWSFRVGRLYKWVGPGPLGPATMPYTMYDPLNKIQTLSEALTMSSSASWPTGHTVKSVPSLLQL